MPFRATALAAVVVVCAAVVVAAAAPALPSYNVDLTQTAVTGLSSGGFMAVQMHVVYSAWVKASGVFAGGPYDCAQGSVSTAELTCMLALTAPDPATYVATTQSRSAAGTIDAVGNVTGSRVYLFSGTQDTTVHPPVMQALAAYYTSLGASVTAEFNLTAAHTQPTDDPANTEPCTVSESPYVSNCQYDGAGAALNAMAAAPLKPRATGALSGSVIAFDQTAFCPNADCAAIALDTTGYAYVPASCAAGSTVCTLLVAFHGCEQSHSAVGMAYVNGAGYNRWADTNDLVVLYPQTVASYVSPSNPSGCWDWFGYTGAAYDQNTGAQPVAIKAMAEQIAAAHHSRA